MTIENSVYLEEDNVMVDNHKLHLSTDDRKILGVCGGIAEYLNIDSTAIRLLWVVVTVFTGFIPGMLAYLIAGFVMPSRDKNIKD